MREIKRMSYKDISDTLGKNISTIKSQIRNGRSIIVSATENVPSNWFNTSTYTFTPQKAGYWEIAAAYDVYRNTEASMAIRKNGSIVASAGSFNAVAQDISKIIYLNGSTNTLYSIYVHALQSCYSNYQQYVFIKYAL